MSDSTGSDVPYCVEPLKAGQVVKAFLLFESIVNDLTLDQWVAYWGGRRDSDAQQIAVATDPAGYVRGLCIAGSPSGDFRTLEVPVFVATSAADPIGVELALMNHLKEFARSRGYSALRVWALDADIWLRLTKGDAVSDAGESILVVL